MWKQTTPIILTIFLKEEITLLNCPLRHGGRSLPTEVLRKVNTIQNRMFEEINDQTIFDLSKRYGMDYLSGIFDRNVYPNDKVLSNLKIFEEELPQNFTPSKEILDQLNDYGSPATVAQVGGRYFGFVNGGIVPAGLAARLLADFWDQNTAMQVISPISSKLERVVEKWLRQIFSLPEKTVAGFVSGTSMATFSGLAAARFRILKEKAGISMRRVFLELHESVLLSENMHIPLS